MMRRWVAIAVLAVEVLAGAGALRAAGTPMMPCCMDHNVLSGTWQKPCCCCVTAPALPTPPASSRDTALQPNPTSLFNVFAVVPYAAEELTFGRRISFKAALSPPDLFLLDSAFRI